ncbi:hypothetical protein EI94DRAFT_1706099 [Lactarius quietus]|nr:hypothetical protein EI94DRAFT_1706099 [Lactarius quietus]
MLDLAHSAMGPDILTQGETSSKEHAQNGCHAEGNGSSEHTQDQDDRMSTIQPQAMPEADTSAAKTHSKSNPGSSHSLQQGPGPNFGGYRSENDQPSSPPNEGDNPDDPEAGVEGDLDSQQQGAGPKADINSSGEDHFVSPQDNGNDLHNPDFNAEGGLNSQQLDPTLTGACQEKIRLTHKH